MRIQTRMVVSGQTLEGVAVLSSLRMNRDATRLLNQDGRVLEVFMGSSRADSPRVGEEVMVTIETASDDG